MAKEPIERCLPADLLQEATLRGNEYAWAARDIPRVIEAARAAGLVNLGGQLQFRVPGGATCEAYWVSVFPYRSVGDAAVRDTLVERSAIETRELYDALSLEYDFAAEVRRGFAGVVDEFQAGGNVPGDAICFVWDVATCDECDQIRDAPGP